MKTPRLHIAGVLAVGAVLGFGGAQPVGAQDKPDDQASKDSTALDAAAAMHGDAKVTADVAQKFAKFAGTEANAEALVTGLRTGDTITLLDSASATTTFKPTTKAMGFGNIMLALSLAREDLAKQGIKNPTPAQIEAALNGGAITTGTGASAKTITMPGVLALRAAGRGWGEIAQMRDVKFAHATSDLRSEAKHVDTIMKPEHLEPTGRPTGVEKPDTAAHPERPERFERPAHGPGAHD